MSSTGKSFKILIASGGVAGLALANMLERFQIDYLFLEAHSNIVPTIGVGIAIFPHGARILDQLDLYEPIAELVDNSGRGDHIHNEDGDCLLNVPEFEDYNKHRHGYPVSFIDRQSLLRILYDRLRNKNCVLLNKKSVCGTLLIGADGVHSVVRREMYRIANEKVPQYFAADEHKHASCHYLCVFGVSQDVPCWVQGETYSVFGKGYSQLVVSGPDKSKIYWFFFARLPETRYGKDIPRRYNREMETQIIKKYEHRPVTKTVTFGQLYAKRSVSTLTPLHEYTHEEWFFNRISIMGDSAHKPNPISGQGGNAAIESAAEFVNALLERRNSRAQGLDRLTDKDIKNIFMKSQIRRLERAKDLVSAAHIQQALTAFEKPLVSKILWEYTLLLGGDSGYLDLFGEKIASDPRLKHLSIKERPRVIPYDDELPSRPRTSNKLHLGRTFLILGLLYILLKDHNFLYYSCSWVDTRKGAMTTFSAARDTSALLRDPFSSKKQIAYNIYGLSRLISPILICIVEGYRLGNRASILALPSLFLLAISFKGIVFVSLLYSVMNAFLSTSSPAGRFVKPEVARVLGELGNQEVELQKIKNSQVVRTVITKTILNDTKAEMCQF
ncbi:monooxygenase, putative [Talaromyces stipitatus ATCC 10500]|uniref:Monooxygenase, putative n=1 Tax=Talaromyces stipitatus (strain ATCC 10500 / CBS 375.48 / QM 6759 / NRRL 1006) TaxID=441959 RepID=B8M383_TALSN|nr:monooxygenase, putative [Talaromyces stipitatus ATCC 10500]EED22255.1 monooxygenase, putative [Talaromyces stipitatus ATCC 10500]